MKTYKQLKFVGEKEVVQSKIELIQNLISKGIEIKYTQVTKQKGFFKRKEFVYEGLLYMPERQDIDFTNVTLINYNDVNHGSYSFESGSVWSKKSLEVFNERVNNYAKKDQLDIWTNPRWTNWSDGRTSNHHLVGDVNGSLEAILYFKNNLESHQATNIISSKLTTTYKEPKSLNH